MYITSSLYPSISVNILQKMITFTAEVRELAFFDLRSHLVACHRLRSLWTLNVELEFGSTTYETC